MMMSQVDHVTLCTCSGILQSTGAALEMSYSQASLSSTFHNFKYSTSRQGCCLCNHIYVALYSVLCIAPETTANELAEDEVDLIPGGRWHANVFQLLFIHVVDGLERCVQVLHFTTGQLQAVLEVI